MGLAQGEDRVSELTPWEPHANHYLQQLSQPVRLQQRHPGV